MDVKQLMDAERDFYRRCSVFRLRLWQIYLRPHGSFLDTVKVFEAKSLEIRASEDDVRRYLDSRMSEQHASHMSFNTFHPGFCATHETFQRRLQLNPLYDYATRNWGHHAREASMVEPLIMNF